MEYVWLALVIIVLGGMWWVGYRMEPHWVSRDGERFMCGAQEFFHGQLGGHPRETHVAFVAGGSLHITQKRMLRRKRSLWWLIGKSADPPKGLEIYVAQQTVDGVATPTMLALRIPKKSRCIALLDAELAKAEAKTAKPTTVKPTTAKVTTAKVTTAKVTTAKVTTGQASPETPSPVDPPDQD